MNSASNRRDFLKTLGVATAGFAAARAAVSSASAAEGARRTGARYMGDFAAPKLETVRWGMIGVGARGSGHAAQLAQIPGSEIVAISDLYEDWTNRSARSLGKLGKPAPGAVFRLAHQVPRNARATGHGCRGHRHAVGGPRARWPSPR